MRYVLLTDSHIVWILLDVCVMLCISIIIWCDAHSLLISWFRSFLFYTHTHTRKKRVHAKQWLPNTHKHDSVNERGTMENIISVSHAVFSFVLNDENEHLLVELNELAFSYLNRHRLTNIECVLCMCVLYAVYSYAIHVRVLLFPIFNGLIK